MPYLQMDVNGRYSIEDKKRLAVLGLREDRLRNRDRRSHCIKRMIEHLDVSVRVSPSIRYSARVFGRSAPSACPDQLLELRLPAIVLFCV
jgi:hypothetical protein